MLSVTNHSAYKDKTKISWKNIKESSLNVAGSIPDEVIWIFNWPNPSSSTVALGSTQRRREMSTRNLAGGKRRPEHKADNLTAICEPIVYKMWEPDVSKPYRPPQTVTKTALPFYKKVIFAWFEVLSELLTGGVEENHGTFPQSLRNWNSCTLHVRVQWCSGNVLQLYFKDPSSDLGLGTYFFWLRVLVWFLTL
jgi:hypothetical protein